MMGVGVKRGFIIRHMDIVTALLYSYLDVGLPQLVAPDV